MDLDSGPFEIQPYSVLQGEAGTRYYVLPELCCELRGELGGDLVAATADGWPDVSPQAGPTERARRFPRDAGEGSAPAGVDHPDLAFAHERDGDTVGHGHGEAEVRLGTHERVGIPGEAWPGDAYDTIPGDLADPRRRPAGHGGPDQGEVLLDRFRGVTDFPGNVQRVVGGVGDAAEAGEEESSGPLGDLFRGHGAGGPLPPAGGGAVV